MESIRLIYEKYLLDENQGLSVSKKKILGMIGFWTAAGAASMLALNLTISGWAYILFIISNIATIVLLRHSDADKSVRYQIIFFFFVNLLGIYNWLL